MNKEKLAILINAHYISKRAFINSFNNTVGFNALDETVLSRQLSGGRALSAAWKCAYILYFNDAKHQSNEQRTEN